MCVGGRGASDFNWSPSCDEQTVTSSQYASVVILFREILPNDQPFRQVRLFTK